MTRLLIPSLMLSILILSGCAPISQRHTPAGAATGMLVEYASIPIAGVELLDNLSGNNIDKLYRRATLPESMKRVPEGKVVAEKTDESQEFRFFNGTLGPDNGFVLYQTAINQAFYVNEFQKSLGITPEQSTARFILKDRLFDFFNDPRRLAYIAPEGLLTRIEEAVTTCEDRAPGVCPRKVPLKYLFEQLDENGIDFNTKRAKLYYRDSSHGTVHDIGNGHYIFTLNEQYSDFNYSLYRKCWSLDKGHCEQPGDKENAGFVLSDGWKHRFIWNANTGVLTGLSVDHLLSKQVLTYIQVLKNKTPEEVLGHLQSWIWTFNRKILIDNKAWGRDMCFEKLNGEGTPFDKNGPKDRKLQSDSPQPEFIGHNIIGSLSPVGSDNAICKAGASDRRILSAYLAEDLEKGLKAAEKLMPTLKGAKK